MLKARVKRAILILYWNKTCHTHQLTATPWYACPWPQGAQLLVFNTTMDNNKRKEIKCPIRNGLINPSPWAHNLYLCAYTFVCLYGCSEQPDTAVRSALPAGFVAATQRGKQIWGGVWGLSPSLSLWTTMCLLFLQILSWKNYVYRPEKGQLVCLNGKLLMPERQLEL